MKDPRDGHRQDPRRWAVQCQRPQRVARSPRTGSRPTWGAALPRGRARLGAEGQIV